jgi:hypothetical protein
MCMSCEAVVHQSSCGDRVAVTSRQHAACVSHVLGTFDIDQHDPNNFCTTGGGIVAMVH